MKKRSFQRNTRQRIIILEELKSTRSHPTAMELYERVRRRIPNISLGTVYRNLDLLVRSGQIMKLGYSGNEARYDGNPEKHFHIRCVDCGRVDDIDDFPENPFDDDCIDLKGYEVLGFRLEFSGRCPDCRRKHKNTKSTREES